MVREAPRPLSARTIQPDDFIGRSRSMKKVFELVGQVALSRTSVLVRGESGTGKERIAQLIHEHSQRADGPFVRVNCAALPESIIESELFGHEKGAFTGAIADRQGRFELAHGGTIFLDEVGDLSLSAQVKLLRVLQEREFERVGAAETQPVDVRVIAATHRDLEALIEAGSFREDLYYRLNVFPVHVPPLRERGSDVLLLVDHFIDVYNREHARQVKRVSTPAIDMLTAYHWPGNVRELENCIERAVLVASEGVIQGRHLPPTLQTADATGTRTHGTLQQQLDALERELIVEALKHHRGNMAAAARELDVSERVMGLRVKKYDLDLQRFKAK